MVHFLGSAGLTPINKRFISAMALIAVCVSVLTGCHSIVQPSRSKLAEMNSFLEGSYQLEISVDMLDGDFALQYDTTVEAAGEKAVWNGKASVYCMSAYFFQDCLTCSDAGSSCKQWRSGWVASDAQSTLEQIRQWQRLSADGKGKYQKKPAPIADFHEDLADCDAEVYAVTMKGVDVDWNSVCDADLDLVFGGNDRLDKISQIDATLLYAAEDLQLKAVLLSYVEGEKWVSACIAITQTGSVPEFDLSTFTLLDGYPSEEWEMYSGD